MAFEEDEYFQIRNGAVQPLGSEERQIFQKVLPPALWNNGLRLILAVEKQQGARLQVRRLVQPKEPADNFPDQNNNAAQFHGTVQGDWVQQLGGSSQGNFDEFDVYFWSLIPY